MRRTRPARPRRRGISLIEVTISLGVLAVGMLGMFHMQVVAVRANQFSRNLAIASSVAHDLTENVALWPYADPRLVALATINTFSDEPLVQRLDLPRDRKLSGPQVMQFAAEAGDESAAVANALGAYDGSSSDVLRFDEATQRLEPFFLRYWTVFDVDRDRDGIPDGKLVLVVVRWPEPGVGMRQVTTTAFRPNSEVFSL
jgi:hypothetical protein